MFTVIMDNLVFGFVDFFQ